MKKIKYRSKVRNFVLHNRRFFFKENTGNEEFTDHEILGPVLTLMRRSNNFSLQLFI